MHYFLLIFLLLMGQMYGLKDLTPESTQSTDIGMDAADYTEASSEASHIINLIDQEQYRSAWSDMGPLFKELIPQDVFIAGMVGIRKPLSYVRSRRVTGYDDFTDLPGNLTGNFYRITYRTEFHKGGIKQESLVLMNAKLDRWRVISYSVK